MSNKDNKIIFYSFENIKNNTYEEFLIWQVLGRILHLIQINVLSQQVILNKDIGKYYIVDFLIMPFGIIIEIDGQQHLDNIEYDSQRDNFLESLGLFILRFDNKLVRENLREVIITIFRAITQRITCRPTKDFRIWLKESKLKQKEFFNKYIDWNTIKELNNLEKQRKNLYKDLNIKKKIELKDLANDLLKQMFLNIN